MAPQSRDMPLILASTSPYRADLLKRLGLPFEVVSPGVDETPPEGTAEPALAAALAARKAAAVATRHPDAWVIGSDQVAWLDGQSLGKPGNVARAREQLARSSGRTLRFDTAVCLRCVSAGFEAVETARTEVRFRELDAREIQRYVERERPIDCAGSFKVEASGISLFEWIRGDDPTALEGLPLIALCHLLRQAGRNLP